MGNNEIKLVKITIKSCCLPDHSTIFEIKEQLSNQLFEYIAIIKKEYSSIMPLKILEYLNNIKDFK